MKLGVVIAGYRQANDVRLLDLSQEIGLTKSVLHRIEKGQDCSAEALRAVLAWLLITDLGRSALRQDDGRGR